MEFVERDQIINTGAEMHAWRRALEIAHDDFPLAYETIFDLWITNVPLDLYLNDDGDGYYVSCPGIEGWGERAALLNPVWAALATDRKEYEVSDAKDRLARLAVAGPCLPETYRGRTEGFGAAAFDEEYVQLVEQKRAAAAKKRRRGLRFGLPVKILRGRAARKALRREKRRRSHDTIPTTIGRRQLRQLGDGWELLTGNPDIPAPTNPSLQRANAELAHDVESMWQRGDML